MKPNSRVLVIGPSWVGDMVMTQCLFKALKAQDPLVQIDVVAPGWSLPVLKRMPEVNNAIQLDIKHGKLALYKRYRFAKQLRSHYDQSIVIPRSLKAALIPWLAKIPRRTGWLGEYRYFLLNDIRYLKPKKLPKMVQRLVALAYDKSASIPDAVLPPALDINPQEVQSALTALNLNVEKKPILALCPGAEYGSAKRWPAKHFAKVAQHFHQLGWQIWILGSANDRIIADELQVASNNSCINLTGKTSLTQCVDLLSTVDMVLTNDSGLMHIAASLDKPMLVLFGSTNPGYTPPLSNHADYLFQNLACSPCAKRECPLQHHACMESITPSQVIAKVQTVFTAHQKMNVSLESAAHAYA